MPTTNNIEVNIEYSPNLPNIKNYAEFMAQIQQDKQFKKMVQGMTLGLATGGSSLAKYKYKWK